MPESLPVGQGSGRACAGVNDGGRFTLGVLYSTFTKGEIKTEALEVMYISYLIAN